MTVNITATLVKALRDRTAAGMMECKRALQENNGDLEKAVEALRKSGLAKADKKTGVTAEGTIVGLLSDDKKSGILLEVNCQTDFVGRGADFVEFSQSVAETALKNKINSIDSLLNQVLKNGETVEETRRALVAKVGENIQVRRLAYMESSHQLISYIHSGRIGTLVNFEGQNAGIGKDIAMHIVASAPLVVNPTEISQEIIDKEKEIFSAQAASSGKPENIIAKMVEGRIQKFLDEVSLIGQPFVKNPDETVGKLLENAHAKVHAFKRFAVGEGIEKKTENFADEVMAQVKGS